MSEKTEEAIKNGQSIETGNTRYTRHRTQDQDKKNTTQKTNNMLYTFFVAFFSATIDDRNLIFGHKLYIDMPYCG
jgi:hypothetical protein